MSCGSESGTTPLWPSPQRIGSHSGSPSSYPPVPSNGWLSESVSPVRKDPPSLSSSPVEQKKKVCVVTNCFGVHMFALTTVFCFKKSEIVLILLSNLNLSDSIQVDPNTKLVLSNLGTPGPIYRVLGSSLVLSVACTISHGPLRGT